MTKVSKADRDRVALIIHRQDWARIDQVGGYETEWTIENGKLYWADLDPGKEYRATTLVVMPVRTFIAQNRDWWVNDDLASDVEESRFRDSKKTPDGPAGSAPRL